MKLLVPILGVMMATATPMSMQEVKIELPALVPVNQRPFDVGERLDFRIHYGFVDAGEASISIEKKMIKSGKSVYYMRGVGKSTGMTRWFFPADDVYETYMDTKTLLPVEFVRDVNEDGVIIKRHIYFDRSDSTAIDAQLDKDSVFNFDREMHDIFSCFYYARSMDVTGIKVGDIKVLDVFLDHELFPFMLKYQGKEELKTDFGKIRCMKFMPVVQEGRVFKEKESMTIWVTDDANRVPVRLQSDLMIGSVKIDLVKFQGLKNTGLLK